MKHSSATSGTAKAALLVTGILLAACSDLSAGPPSAGPTSTAVQTGAFGTAFRTATDQYLARSQAAQAVSRQALSGQGSVRDAYGQILAATLAAQKQYAALAPPPEYMADVNRLRSTLDDQANSLEAILRAIDGSNTENVDAEMRRLAESMNEMMEIQSSLLGRLDAARAPP